MLSFLRVLGPSALFSSFTSQPCGAEAATGGLKCRALKVGGGLGGDNKFWEGL